MNGMKRRLPFALACGLALLLTACGGADAGGDATDAPDEAELKRNAWTASTRAASSSTELIDTAQSDGDIDATTALSYRVFALFRDARLPAKYQGGVSEAIDSALLADLNSTFETLPPESLTALAPFLARPAQAESWATPAGVVGQRADIDPKNRS